MSRRLIKELLEFETSPPDWCTVSPVEDNMMHWNAIVIGPENTPYAGGAFTIDILFSNDYPFKAPKLKFATRVYHPNIKTQTGEICADIINENWSPTLNVLYCLTAIMQILEHPNTDNPLEPEIAKLLQDERQEFEKTAMEWTKQYA
ncbi:hypothetical protein ABG067_000362 [Albugo candida]|uniref:E2 ubiquitin-conjugating enzyme n=1 Tax=Albugo candida TaxID=65357 RepID=A0A024G3H9_9STRA|nr:unnamed protein product [Albugo candida]|eukprot:CCI41231.1 unnamed protein product [Albugo candida]